MDTSPSSSPLPSSSPITAVDLTSLNELDTSIEAVNDLLSLNSASTLDDDHEEKGEVDEEEEGEEEGVIGVDGGPDDVGGDILGLNSNNVDRVADVKREDTSSHPLSISPNRALANLTSMISRAKVSKARPQEIASSPPPPHLTPHPPTHSAACLLSQAPLQEYSHL